jgi:hypothetical protein
MMKNKRSATPGDEAALSKMQNAPAARPGTWTRVACSYRRPIYGARALSGSLIPQSAFVAFDQMHACELAIISKKSPGGGEDLDTWFQSSSRGRVV